MSLLCSCYKCKQSTPFDRACEHCGYENPVYPDSIENVAKKWLEKHENIEVPVSPPPVPVEEAQEPVVAAPTPQHSPAPIVQPSQPSTLPTANPVRPGPILGMPLIVVIHPVLGLCAGALLGYSLSVDDFTERLIYYCAAGIALMVDMVLLTVEADRMLAYGAQSLTARLINALATLPICVVLVWMGVDEMALGFGLLPSGWLATLWGLKSLGVGLALTLLGVGFGVYTCELVKNKRLI